MPSWRHFEVGNHAVLQEFCKISGAPNGGYAPGSVALKLAYSHHYITMLDKAETFAY